MHTGYYKEQEVVQVEEQGFYDYRTSDYEFMDIVNLFTDENLDLYKYLHGYCDDFACALNRRFGYDIVSIWSETNKLIHAYCVKPAMFDGDKNYFIDARGVTDDWEEFIEEFRDEYSDDLYDEPACSFEVQHTADDFIDMCVIEKGKDWNSVEIPEIVNELKKIMSSIDFKRDYDVNSLIKKAKDNEYIQTMT